MVYGCTGVVVYGCTGVVVYGCTGLVVYGCTGVVVYGCSGVVVASHESSCPVVGRVTVGQGEGGKPPAGGDDSTIQAPPPLPVGNSLCKLWKL